MSVETRQQPKTAYLIETRLLGADDLPDFLHRSSKRLQRKAGTLGGATGPATVFYPEPVTKTVDGHVINSLPIPLPEGEPEDHVLVEDECEMACLKVSKAQVAEILAAYDDVFAWVEAKNFRVAGSPREIYLADLNSASDHDLVCEVAVPFVRH
ncbi:hypothetical protein JT358_08700 [Micrococcales bacterium 31B]|nr:hypothetical protein [Micrococcales bacterium 31B]